MKQLTIIAAGLLLTISSCTTSGSGSGTSVTPTTSSTFNITYNGKTYHLASTATVPLTIVNATTFSSTSPSTGIMTWDINAVASNSHIQCNIGGIKFTDVSTAVGTYKAGCGGGTTLSTLNLTDYDDGGKMYQTDCTGADTTSTVTVTSSTSTECKGTFNVILSYSGHYYPATGDFDYHH